MFIVHLCNIYILKTSLCGLMLTCAFQVTITSTVTSLQKAKRREVMMREAFNAMQDGKMSVRCQHKKPSLSGAQPVNFSSAGGWKFLIHPFVLSAL